ncbi:MAG: maleylpyruvate isomerase family mycothiol-dependent enzyme [Ilumatobacteraceae bacterium]
MTDRDRALQGVTAAHRTLEQRLQGVTDDQARQPSLLPGWTVGHVLTHIARNADGLRRMVEGAARGEVAEMYPGGFDARNADIEAGAGRTAEALVDDVRVSAARLELAFDGLPADAWSREGITVFGPAPIDDLPGRRWREVEVHHADLGLGYGPREWPADYVRSELRVLTMLWDSRRPMGLTGLPPEAFDVDERTRLAWLLGRAEIAGLPAAGLLG